MFFELSAPSADDIQQPNFTQLTILYRPGTPFTLMQSFCCDNK